MMIPINNEDEFLGLVPEEKYLNTPVGQSFDEQMFVRQLDSLKTNALRDFAKNAVNNHAQQKTEVRGFKTGTEFFTKAMENCIQNIHNKLKTQKLLKKPQGIAYYATADNDVFPVRVEFELAAVLSNDIPDCCFKKEPDATVQIAEFQIACWTILEVGIEQYNKLIELNPISKEDLMKSNFEPVIVSRCFKIHTLPHKVFVNLALTPRILSERKRNSLFPLIDSIDKLSKEVLSKEGENNG